MLLHGKWLTFLRQNALTETFFLFNEQNYSSRFYKTRNGVSNVIALVLVTISGDSTKSTIYWPFL